MTMGWGDCIRIACVYGRWVDGGEGNGKWWMVVMQTERT
jgi:hypothetical protein